MHRGLPTAYDLEALWQLLSTANVAALRRFVPVIK